ncbi:MAG: hypothetical protein ACJ8KO_05875, partial [Sulfurifustaceae bacterium]
MLERSTVDASKIEINIQTPDYEGEQQNQPPDFGTPPDQRQDSTGGSAPGRGTDSGEDIEKLFKGPK